jgi:hypothetical protein
MGNESENRLRGRKLTGAEQPEAADHVDYAEQRDSDAELHLDGEKDTLYDDGLDVEDDSLKLADTKDITGGG